MNNLIIERLRELKTFSIDPSNKVAAIFTIENSQEIVATGFNKLYDYVDQTKVDLLDKTHKNFVVQHAEISALNEMSSIVTSSTRLDLYVTLVPCPMCLYNMLSSKFIINKIYFFSIGSSTFRLRHNIDRSFEIFKEKGIEFEFVDILI